MKQIILFGLLAGFLSVHSSLRAQVAPRDSDAHRGSRLELGRTAGGRKPAQPVLSNQRFSLLHKPAPVTLDRPASLSKNAPINAYYRSLLVGRPGSKLPSRSGNATDGSTNATGDVRLVAESENRTDDRMYTSDKLLVSNIYPNPASDWAEISYQITGPVSDARLVLINVLGSPVAEYPLEKNDHKIRIQTGDMMTGVYFYQLSVDGKKVATKKLLVRHQ
ncbi:hypothetical protein GCM10027578_37130 [Spirosoma luteolum]